MLVRELRDKLNRIPEEYLDLEVCIKDDSYNVWHDADIVASVNILHHKRCGGTFLGIGENFDKNLETIWPNLDERDNEEE